jgi:hypothetical protein
VAEVHRAGAGRDRRRDLEDKNNAWRTGGGTIWVTGTYDPATNQTFWGTGSPVPCHATRPIGRATLYQQRDLLRSRQRQHELVLPVRPGDMWDFDGSAPTFIDGNIAGQPRKLITSAQRLPLHHGAGERTNRSRQALHEVNWTRASTRRPASRSTMILARTSGLFDERQSGQASRPRKVLPRPCRR